MYVLGLAITIGVSTIPLGVVWRPKDRMAKWWYGVVVAAYSVQLVFYLNGVPFVDVLVTMAIASIALSLLWE